MTENKRMNEIRKLKAMITSMREEMEASEYKSFKEIDADIHDCAEETGYHYEFLLELVQESIEEAKELGMNVTWAVRNTLETAYELDF